MSIREALLARIAEYLQANGLSERAFGLAVCRDHKLVQRLRSSSITLDRVEKTEAFMRDHPHGLPRPTQAQASDVSRSEAA